MCCLKRVFVKIYLFKPIQVAVSSMFLLLIIYSCGLAWAKILPTQSSVEGTRFEGMGSIIHFLNPGPFGLKEVCGVASNFSGRLCLVTHKLSQTASMSSRPWSPPRPPTAVRPYRISPCNEQVVHTVVVTSAPLNVCAAVL
jgi:hypothetical protein